MRSIEGFRWISQPHALLSGGRQRKYRLYRPSGLGRAGSVPLVVFLHGGFGSGAQAEYAYGWDDAADRHGFVVAYPDGIGRSWNAGACCGPARQEGIDDVGFLRALVEQVGAAERIDPDRVFCTGISNGAMMAYRAACQLPRLFAAIGPVAGTMVCSCPGPAPTSVLHIHGLDDAMVPFAGGLTRQSLVAPHPPSVLSVLDVWRQAGGCGPPRVIESKPVRTEIWSGPGVEVALTTIAGAGHQWPGGRPAAPRVARLFRLDPPSGAMNATESLWSFFAAHPRRD